MATATKIQFKNENRLYFVLQWRSVEGSGNPNDKRAETVTRYAFNSIKGLTKLDSVSSSVNEIGIYLRIHGFGHCE